MNNSFEELKEEWELLKQNNTDMNTVKLEKVLVDNFFEIIEQQQQEIERYKKVLQEIVGFSKYEGNQWYEDIKNLLEESE